MGGEIEYSDGMTLSKALEVGEKFEIMRDFPSLMITRILRPKKKTGMQREEDFFLSTSNPRIPNTEIRIKSE